MAQRRGNNAVEPVDYPALDRRAIELMRARVPWEQAYIQALDEAQQKRDFVRRLVAQVRVRTGNDA